MDRRRAVAGAPDKTDWIRSEREREMPTTIDNRPLQYIECCGVVVPITNSREEADAAHWDLLLGAVLAVGAAIPPAVCTFLYLYL